MDGERQRQRGLSLPSLGFGSDSSRDSSRVATSAAVVIQEAELELGSGGAVWTEIELLIG